MFLEQLEARIVLLCDDGPCEYIAVSIEKFGGRVHHEIGAKVDWPCPNGGRIGRIDRNERSVRMRESRKRFDVANVLRRVRRTLQPKELRVWLKCTLRIVDACEIDEIDFDSIALRPIVQPLP